MYVHHTLVTKVTAHLLYHVKPVVLGLRTEVRYGTRSRYKNRRRRRLSGSHIHISNLGSTIGCIDV